MEQKLIDIIDQFTTALHEFEADNNDIPEWLDNIWGDLTESMVHHHRQQTGEE